MATYTQLKEKIRTDAKTGKTNYLILSEMQLLIRVEPTTKKAGKMNTNKEDDFRKAVYELELEMLKRENTMLKKFFADNDILLPEGVSK